MSFRRMDGRRDDGLATIAKDGRHFRPTPRLPVVYVCLGRSSCVDAGCLRPRCDRDGAVCERQKPGRILPEGTSASQWAAPSFVTPLSKSSTGATLELLDGVDRVSGGTRVTCRVYRTDKPARCMRLQGCPGDAEFAADLGLGKQVHGGCSFA